VLTYLFETLDWDCSVIDLKVPGTSRTSKLVLKIESQNQSIPFKSFFRGLLFVDCEDTFLFAGGDVISYVLCVKWARG